MNEQDFGAFADFNNNNSHIYVRDTLNYVPEITEILLVSSEV